MGLPAILGRLMQRRLARNILVGGYGQAVQMVMQFVGVPLMLSVWGVETYGIWILLFAVPSYLAVADFGIATAATNDMVALAAQGRRDEVAALFGATRRFVGTIIAIVLVFAVAFAMSPLRYLLDFASASSHGWPLATFLLLAIYGVSAIWNNVTMAGFSAADNYAKGGAIFQTIGLIEGALGLLAVYLSGSILMLAAAYCGVRLAGSIVTGAVLRRVAPWLSDRGRQKLAVLRRLTRPALASVALPAANATAFQGSLIGLGTAAGAAATPSLAIPRTATRFALQIAMIVSVASIQRFTIAHSLDAEERKAALAAVNFATALVLLIPAAVIMLTVGPWLVALWTNGHLIVGRDVIVPLVLSLLLAGLWYPLSNFLVALNRHALFAFRATAMSLAAVGVGTLLAPRYGAVGMAWCIAVFDAAMLLTITRIVLREKVIDLRQIKAVLSRTARQFQTFANSRRGSN